MCSEYIYCTNSIRFAGAYQIIHICMSYSHRPGQWIQDGLQRLWSHSLINKINHETHSPLPLPQEVDRQSVLDQVLRVLKNECGAGRLTKG